MKTICAYRFYKIELHQTRAIKKEYSYSACFAGKHEFSWQQIGRYDKKQAGKTQVVRQSVSYHVACCRYTNKR